MFTKLYLIALPIFFAIDLVWVGLIAKGFYAKHIGYLLRPDVNWVAAVIFYLIFTAGLVVFVITPAVEKGQVMHALVYGAFFGLVAYASYDLTNSALTKDWPLIVTVVDMAWGAFLAAAVSSVTVLVAMKW